MTAADERDYKEYQDALQRAIDRRGLKRRLALLKRGEAILWAASLLHGGMPVMDPNRTQVPQESNPRPSPPCHSNPRKLLTVLPFETRLSQAPLAGLALLHRARPAGGSVLLGALGLALQRAPDPPQELLWQCPTHASV